MPLLSVNDLRQRNSNTPLQIMRRAWNMSDDEKIIQIMIVSAFTDVKAIRKLINELRSEKTQNIILLLDYGASGYHRDREATEELNKLSILVKKHFSPDSGLFLIQIGRFLHSKIIFLKTNKGKDLASVGSLNFTFRGLHSNEEIIYNVKNPKSVIKYTEKLKRYATKIPFDGRKSQVACTYRDWMLQGAMFYEDKDSNPFNFKLNLPEDIRQQANEIVGLPAETPDNLTVFYVLNIPKNKTKMGWKKFCISTCYGHWCPKQLLVETTKSINNKIESTVQKRIKPILDDKEKLKNKYLKKFDFIEERIDKFNKVHGTNYEWDKNNAIKRIDNWIEKTLKKLQNEDQLKRLVAGVSGPVVVPDFWSGDLLALKDFEQSFCEHMIIELSKKSVQNWIAQWFRDYFEFPENHPLGQDWDEAWSDEDNWWSWLTKQDQDPFEKLPGEWLD
jgi:phosphatidylserine/phosphatidylglycerophosphate/cardiolipin synthase-like enzyme